MGKVSLQGSSVSLPGTKLAQEKMELDDFYRLDEAQFKWCLKAGLKKVANLSELVACFQHHRAILAPLATRIEATDRLIDQIVYRLYGLTKEEIAVVEGSACSNRGH